MEINELELEEEMIKVESSPESNSSLGSSKKRSNTELVTTSIDHDPGVTYLSACSSSFIASEDLYQDEVQSGITESTQSKLEDGKTVDDTALGTSAMATPTKQIMDKDEDTKPYRIPSSVFNKSDASAPADWSGTSNDSLFSLHGAISASKDQSPLLREESDKSRTEEATKLEDLPSNLPQAAASNEVVDAKEKEVERKELVIDKTEGNCAKKHSSEDELAKHSSSVRGSSVSCRSDASDGSTFSFAFPILASGRTQTSAIKEGGSSPNTTHSMEPHSQPQDNDLNTPSPQAQSASRKSFFSCFSNCCFPSFCSCSSCWPFKS